MSAPARLEVRVYYEDTDLAGIVYHANYLKFFERGRTEALRALGIGQEALRAESGLVFAVTRMEIAFRAPARLDDVLTVETRLEVLRHASFDMAQTIRRDDTLLCTASVAIACLDASLRPARLPAVLRTTLDQMLPKG